jgi:hypothetical protein
MAGPDLRDSGQRFVRSLPGVRLVVAKGGAGVHLETADSALRRKLQVNSGKGQSQRVGELHAPLRKLIRKREFLEFRLAPLSSCVTIVRREGVDCSRENMRANRVDAHIGALDKRLELGWTPADLIEALQVIFFQRLDDRAYAADRFVDHAFMPGVKGADPFRVSQRPPVKPEA